MNWKDFEIQWRDTAKNVERGVRIWNMGLLLSPTSELEFYLMSASLRKILSISLAFIVVSLSAKIYETVRTSVKGISQFPNNVETGDYLEMTV